MQEKAELFEQLLGDVKKYVNSTSKRDVRLKAICASLRSSVAHYDWVGFYLVDESAENELVLGPFVGAPTEHVRIPFGKGICGQAAERKEAFVVQDVRKESNYLSCSVNVRSEIVVPILKNENIVGELDIDSHTPSTFSQEDREFLERVCEMVAEMF